MLKQASEITISMCIDKHIQSKKINKKKNNQTISYQKIIIKIKLFEGKNTDGHIRL